MFKIKTEILNKIYILYYEPILCMMSYFHVGNRMLHRARKGCSGGLRSSKGCKLLT